MSRMNIAQRDEVRRLFQFPLLETIAHRRSRRFPQGCALENDVLQQTSKLPPLPLSDVEHAILCWSGIGLTGSITGDLPVSAFGSAFGSWQGRATPYPCNVHNTRLFFTNDDGVFFYFPKKITKQVEVKTEADGDWIMESFEQDRLRVSAQRVEFLPKALLNAMHWNTNKPGTTVFIPVVDQSEEYIDFLLALFSGEGYRIFDDLKQQPAGLEKWIAQKAIKGPQVLLKSFEFNLMLGNLAPAYLMLENMHLVAEAMGLGSVMFSGYVGVVMLGGTSLSKGLGFRFTNDKNGQVNPVGLDGIFEGYCPPYYHTMADAVDAIVEKKFGSQGCFSAGYGGIVPFKQWEKIQPEFVQPSPKAISMVKDYCTYVYETYGRFPATTDTMILPVWLQVHHLDIDFYEKYMNKELLTETHRRHNELWHK
jgi:hypothetical protein